MRLDKWLANMGYGSRKEIKLLLKKETVLVDDVRVKDGKMQVNPDEQTVTLNGTEIIYCPVRYWMLNKPKGVVSATEDANDKTVIDLLTESDQHFSSFPVGRLDKDTEGLLLLTNDGALAHDLLSPKKHVDKVYFAKIAGRCTENDVANFARGLKLDDGYLTMPAQLKILTIHENDISDVEVTIQEGKFHQVKRMFQAVSKRVIYLQRVKMGSLILDKSLAKGKYRELTAAELSSLKKDLVNKK